MSELITTGEQTVFADDVVKKRGFIRAKHFSWTEPRNGLITFAAPRFLKVLFLTGLNTAAAYFTITAEEVAAGQYDLVYSNDLEEAIFVNSASTTDLVAEVRKLFKEESGNESG